MIENQILQDLRGTAEDFREKGAPMKIGSDFLLRILDELEHYTGAALSWAEEGHADWCCGPGESCCCCHEEARKLEEQYKIRERLRKAEAGVSEKKTEDPAQGPMKPSMTLLQMVASAKCPCRICKNPMEQADWSSHLICDPPQVWVKWVCTRCGYSTTLRFTDAYNFEGESWVEVRFKEEE